jgi:hypothetical protein
MIYDGRNSRTESFRLCCMIGRTCVAIGQESRLLANSLILFDISYNNAAHLADGPNGKERETHGPPQRFPIRHFSKVQKDKEFPI